MSENTPTVADFATEVAYTVAIVVAASVVIYTGKKAARKVNKTVKRVRVWKKEKP
jgi:hypothetical protein